MHPAWEWECTFDQVCQAGAASLSGGATISSTTPGYDSTAGYVGNLFKPGSGATWQVLGAPAGSATLTLRYGTFPVLKPVVHTFDLIVNGQKVTTLTAAPGAHHHALVDAHRHGAPAGRHEHRRGAVRSRRRV